MTAKANTPNLTHKQSYVCALVYAVFAILPVSFGDIISDISFILFLNLRYQLYHAHEENRIRARRLYIKLGIGFVAAITLGVLLSIGLSLVQGYPITRTGFPLGGILGALFVAATLPWIYRLDTRAVPHQPPTN